MAALDERSMQVRGWRNLHAKYQRGCCLADWSSWVRLARLHTTRSLLGRSCLLSSTPPVPRAYPFSLVSSEYSVRGEYFCPCRFFWLHHLLGRGLDERWADFVFIQVHSAEIPMKARITQEAPSEKSFISVA